MRPSTEVVCQGRDLYLSRCRDLPPTHLNEDANPGEHEGENEERHMIGPICSRHAATATGGTMS